jgi:anhydro-N-acetylmuramic acid kinase
VRESEYKALGMMSGTSMDGVDLACCLFNLHDDKWSFKIEAAGTLTYDSYWKKRLAGAHLLSGRKLLDLDIDYGNYLGGLARDFCGKNSFAPGLIASHGHTVFHQPEKGVTFQVGNGLAMAVKTGLPVVHDFRSLDVSLGGQGAPLVPVGDRLLFEDYDICLNLGGFSNVSFEKDNRRIAFDISPCNIVLNHFAGKTGLAFDEDGKNARQGSVHDKLLRQLDRLKYYRKEGPKSLGREWLEKEFIPVIDPFDLCVDDVLRTSTEHIAGRIAGVIAEQGKQASSKILITGGGARNSFLMERISETAGVDLRIPDTLLIDFKEALVFAFLGILRSRGEINTLSSVTGATRDSSGGIICYPS